MAAFLKTKKGQTNMAKLGVDIGMGSIFVLAIGLSIAQNVITNLSLTGITGTVAGYVGLIIVAGFIYLVARSTGIL